MDLFATVAALMGLAALFSLVNERLLHMEKTIGFMVLALAMRRWTILDSAWNRNRPAPTGKPNPSIM